MTQELSLDCIRTDGGTQPRATINPEVVNTYAEDMTEGATLPPVDVFYDGENHWLADGFHRIAAARQVGFKTYQCNVHQGTLEQAQWFSFGVNKTHGLRRSNMDKQRAVIAALKHVLGAELSDHKIAEHCGVDHKTVAHWRSDLVVSREIPQIDKREVTRNGTAYKQDTGKIGKSKPRQKPEIVRIPLRNNGAVPYRDDNPQPSPVAVADNDDTFEQIARDAIDCLLQHGHVDDAQQLLRRIGALS